jgi:hypothetical protein
MTDLLISIIIAGAAVGYLVEFINLITIDFFGISVLNKFLTLPLNTGALYLLGVDDIKLLVVVPAATLVSILISKYLNKPTVTRVPRLGGL